MGLLIRLDVESAMFCLAAKKYISGPRLHSCKSSSDFAFECTDRSIVDAIYNYSVEENNSDNTWIINNRSLEVSSYNNYVFIDTVFMVHSRLGQLS